ncbi:GTPase HflX [Secundilactobacillus collinoides]|uniref:GTPase HflX n=2 Tax=Secundilactobacillus collinoides TaxID=33960 RepID=A0A0R2BEK6_SECCO|nr:GTPase HflX [Secundilactobacillus collinoides]KRM78013.1 GTPase [Secundilactobacillus collinoides DSM 20515 = JCM 1123]KZL40056.1 GTP-binding protein [Secundilactobacillus collinoides]
MDNSELTPVINIGLNTGRANFNYGMAELAALSTANNMNVVERIDQSLPKPIAATYFGTGKVEELRDIVVETGAEIVVANDELTPSQIRNLEKVVKVPVMDRTGLILAIFANRAQSREAKLQVQLAKLQYQMPRLHTAANQSLDQQTGTSAGGGFTNRGAGEAQIELSRRTVQRQINHVRHELKEVNRSAEVKRQQREKGHLPNVALIGYTNAGKSTIMNELIKRFGMNDDKQVMVKNMLFATLDTSVRQLQFEDAKKLLLSDTVGFVSQLPTTLVEAFKSTLYEAANADLLVQIVDYSSNDRANMMTTTEKTLREIGVPDLPMLTVFNKADLTDSEYPTQAGDQLVISANDDASIDLLVDAIKKKVFKNFVTATFLIPFDKGDVVSYLNEHASVLNTDYKAEGTEMTAEVTDIDFQRFQKYYVSSEA